ncbi:MAG TPA: addiction module protein [Planctomycetota bacterium]|jgi:putative addiction module component (TIGR02574 family)
MKTLDRIRQKAMSLSPSERACLAHDLIISLDDPDAYELSPAQEAEIQRRVRLVKEGKAKGRPTRDVIADLRKRFG